MIWASNELTRVSSILCCLSLWEPNQNFITTIVMPTITVGDRLPEFTFLTLDHESGQPKSLTTKEISSGRKIALFAIPGAFTPGCSKTHCPSFTSKTNVEKLKELGFAHVYCLATNDMFVMDAFATQQRIDRSFMTMLADGNGQFTAEIGMTLDLTSKQLGLRSQRYGMIVEDGVVMHIGLDLMGEGIEKSTADAMIRASL